MAELMDIIEILAGLLPVLIPFIPMYILSQKIYEKTEFKPRNFALIIGWMAMVLENVSFRVVNFCLADSEEMLMRVVSIGDFVVIAAMVLIFVFISDLKSILFTDLSEDTALKTALALSASFIPIYLALLHLGLGILEFMYMAIWPTGIFILTIDCFEVTDIFRRLKIKSWTLGAAGTLMLLAMPFFSIYHGFSQYVSGDFPRYYPALGEYMALLGSFLFLIPGIQLHRKTEMPEIEGVERENIAIRKFLNNLSMIVGGAASRSILEGAVSGFRKKSDASIALHRDLTIQLDGDWENFFEFLLVTSYQCVGPITFDCSKGIDELESASSRVMEVFRWT
jgi:hypothetical protein